MNSCDENYRNARDDIDNKDQLRARYEALVARRKAEDEGQTV